LSTQSAELSGKQLELLLETVPTGTRIAVLANPAEPDSRARLHYVQGAAQALRVPLHVLAVQSREDLARAFATIAREGLGALLVLSDPLLLGQFRSDIIAFAQRQRVPAMYSARTYVDAGGLMAYGAEPAGHLSARRFLCRPSSQRRHARGPACGAAHEI